MSRGRGPSAPRPGARRSALPSTRPAGERRLRPLRIGLTGPIGCGKSTVAGWLAERGAAVVDADALARETTARGGPALGPVITRFGEAYRGQDGGLDRAALGRLVFADPDALHDLEAIVHPAVRVLLAAAVAAAEAAGAPAVVVEAIKLVETGYAAECDEVWLVACEPAEQRARLAGRGMPADDADRRIAAQGEIVARLRKAVTRVIDTTGERAAAEARVGEAYEDALARHAAGTRGAAGDGPAAGEG